MIPLIYWQSAQLSCLSSFGITFIWDLFFTYSLSSVNLTDSFVPLQLRYAFWRNERTVNMYCVLLHPTAFLKHTAYIYFFNRHVWVQRVRKQTLKDHSKSPVSGPFTHRFTLHYKCLVNRKKIKQRATSYIMALIKVICSKTTVFEYKNEQILTLL